MNERINEWLIEHDENTFYIIKPASFLGDYGYNIKYYATLNGFEILKHILSTIDLVLL